MGLQQNMGENDNIVSLSNDTDLNTEYTRRRYAYTFCCDDKLVILWPK